MEVSLQQGTDEHEIVVRGVEPHLREALAAMAFVEHGERFVRAVPADAVYMDIVLEHLRLHLETTLLQKTGMLAMPWEGALETVISRVEPVGIDWALIGGAALTVQGVEVTPGDIDVITDVDGASRFTELFLDCLLEPTVDRGAFGFFGRAFPGVLLEWLGNERGERGVWSLDSVPFQTVRWRGHELSVPTLDVYLQIEKQRGRHDRVAAIQEVLT
jgi:hypothetical protein